jgi:hypothetical protein
MNVFLDTNVLVNFSQMSSGDLEDAKKITLLSTDNKIKLFIYDLAKDKLNENCEAGSVLAELLDSALDSNSVVPRKSKNRICLIFIFLHSFGSAV